MSRVACKFASFAVVPFAYLVATGVAVRVRVTPHGPAFLAGVGVLVLLDIEGGGRAVGFQLFERLFPLGAHLLQFGCKLRVGGGEFGDGFAQPVNGVSLCRSCHGQVVKRFTKLFGDFVLYLVFGVVGY